MSEPTAPDVTAWAERLFLDSAVGGGKLLPSFAGSRAPRSKSSSERIRRPSCGSHVRLRGPVPFRETMRHLVLLTPAALLAAAVVTGCEDPSRPKLSYSLNANIVAEEQSNLFIEELAADSVAQAHLLGALEMLFGTPQAPGYLRTEEWIDDDYDPNHADLELSDEQWQEVVTDNRRAFAGELARIAERDFKSVLPPREALDLQEEWNAFVERWTELEEEVERNEADASELDSLAVEITEEGTLLFEEWYPTLRESAEMYRTQCYHCHGTEGGADGSTARFLNPLPRDYRRGIFKYTALDNKARPRRADLYNTLEEGVYGTAMPSFKRFSRAQLEGLVDYVRLLSIRGETEILLSTEYDAEVGGFPSDTVMETYLDVWAKWDRSAEELIVFEGEIPRDRLPERIAHGRELFMDAKSANCFSCHGPDGRGGGPSAFEAKLMTDELQASLERIDAAIAEATRTENSVQLAKFQKKRFEIANAKVKDDWGNEIEPRDLTRGTFRFGRRPIDLFRRIYAGINGTPMPSHSSLKAPDGSRLLSDEDLWDIVHYLRALSSHAPSPEANATPATHGAHGL